MNDINHLSNRPELSQKIYDAVCKEDPKNATKVQRSIETYTGDPGALKKVLIAFGTWNPYAMARRMVVVREVYNDAEEIQRLVDLGEIQPLTRGQSGQQLKSQLFLVSDRDNPSLLLPFGYQSLVQMTQEWGTQEQQKSVTEAGQVERMIKKEERAHRALLDIPHTLEDILTDPSKISEVRKRTDRQKLHAILGLDEEIRRRAILASSLMLEDAGFIDEQKRGSYLLWSQKGGSIPSFVDKHIDELPSAVKARYVNLMSRISDPGDAQFKEDLAVVVVYAMKNMRIDPEAAIGGHIRDFRFINRLPDEHPIIIKYGRADITKVNHLMDRPDITLIEATAVFDAYPNIGQVRMELGQAYYDNAKERIEQTLEELSCLFVQDGKIRKDSYGPSLPAERLMQSIYAAVLTRDDFRAVWKAVRHGMIARFPGGIYRSLGIEQFKQMYDKVQAAGKKIAALKAKLAEDQVAVINPENAPEIVEKYRGKIISMENHANAESFCEKHGMTLDEFIKRADDLKLDDQDLSLSHFWSRHRDAIIKVSSYGLYQPDWEDYRSFSRIINASKALVPASTLGEDYIIAYEGASVIAEGIILPLRKTKRTAKDRSFFTAEEAAIISRVAAIVKPVVTEDRQRAVPLLPKRLDLLHRIIYRGSLKQTGTVVALGDFYKREPVMHLAGGISVHDLRDLEVRMAEYEKGYTKSENLDELWKSKASFVFTYLEEPVCAKSLGMLRTHPVIGGIMMQNKFLISDDLMAEISEAYDQVSKRIEADNTIMTGKAEFMANLLNNQSRYIATIRGTRHQDSELWKQTAKRQNIGIFWNKDTAGWQAYGTVTSLGVIRIMNLVRSYNSIHNTALHLDLS